MTALEYMSRTADLVEELKMAYADHRRAYSAYKTGKTPDYRAALRRLAVAACAIRKIDAAAPPECRAELDKAANELMQATIYTININTADPADEMTDYGAFAIRQATRHLLVVAGKAEPATPENVKQLEAVIGFCTAALTRNERASLKLHLNTARKMAADILADGGPDLTRQAKSLCFRLDRAIAMANDPATPLEDIDDKVAEAGAVLERMIDTIEVRAGIAALVPA